MSETLRGGATKTGVRLIFRSEAPVGGVAVREGQARSFEPASACPWQLRHRRGMVRSAPGGNLRNIFAVGRPAPWPAFARKPGPRGEAFRGIAPEHRWEMLAVTRKGRRSIEPASACPWQLRHRRGMVRSAPGGNLRIFLRWAALRLGLLLHASPDRGAKLFAALLLYFFQALRACVLGAWKQERSDRDQDEDEQGRRSKTCLRHRELAHALLSPLSLIDLQLP